jgi:hypothetical protein
MWKPGFWCLSDPKRRWSYRWSLKKKTCGKVNKQQTRKNKTKTKSKFDRRQRYNDSHIEGQCAHFKVNFVLHSFNKVTNWVGATSSQVFTFTFFYLLFVFSKLLCWNTWKLGNTFLNINLIESFNPGFPSSLTEEVIFPGFSMGPNLAFSREDTTLIFSEKIVQPLIKINKSYPEARRFVCWRCQLRSVTTLKERMDLVFKWNDFRWFQLKTIIWIKS